MCFEIMIELSWVFHFFSFRTSKVETRSSFRWIIDECSCVLLSNSTIRFRSFVTNYSTGCIHEPIIITVTFFKNEEKRIELEMDKLDIFAMEVVSSRLPYRKSSITFFLLQSLASIAQLDNWYFRCYLLGNTILWWVCQVNKKLIDHDWLSLLYIYRSQVPITHLHGEYIILFLEVELNLIWWHSL